MKALLSPSASGPSDTVNETPDVEQAHSQELDHRQPHEWSGDEGMEIIIHQKQSHNANQHQGQSSDLDSAPGSKPSFGITRPLSVSIESPVDI